MKNLVLMGALAAGLAAAAPSAAVAGPTTGLGVNKGRIAGHLTLIDHSDRNYRRGRRYCESWRRVHRKLHRRFDHVRLRRRVYNRRGDKVFIAHARNHRGRAVRIRYNSCTRRIIRVKRTGRYYGRHRGRHCQSWQRAHHKLHRRFDAVELRRRTRNRRGHRIFIARAETRRGRPVRVRYNACTRRVTKVVRLGGHHRDRHHGRHDRRQWRR